MNAKGQKPVATETVSHYTTKITYSSGNMEYLGKADIGANTATSVWQIKKMVYDVDGNLTDIQFADGDDVFDNIWDNRESLSYL
jgi:hypothetical protein